MSVGRLTSGFGMASMMTALGVHRLRVITLGRVLEISSVARGTDPVFSRVSRLLEREKIIGHTPPGRGLDKVRPRVLRQGCAGQTRTTLRAA